LTSKPSASFETNSEWLYGSGFHHLYVAQTLFLAHLEFVLRWVHGIAVPDPARGVYGNIPGEDVDEYVVVLREEGGIWVELTRGECIALDLEGAIRLRNALSLAIADQVVALEIRKRVASTLG